MHHDFGEIDEICRHFPVCCAVHGLSLFPSPPLFLRPIYMYFLFSLLLGLFSLSQSPSGKFPGIFSNSLRTPPLLFLLRTSSTGPARSLSAQDHVTYILWDNTSQPHGTSLRRRFFWTTHQHHGTRTTSLHFWSFLASSQHFSPTSHPQEAGKLFPSDHWHNPPITTVAPRLCSMISSIFPPYQLLSPPATAFSHGSLHLSADSSSILPPDPVTVTHQQCT